jgi:hypothetical protein
MGADEEGTNAGGSRCGELSIRAGGVESDNNRDGESPPTTFSLTSSDFTSIRRDSLLFDSELQIRQSTQINKKKQNIRMRRRRSEMTD